RHEVEQREGEGWPGEVVQDRDYRDEGQAHYDDEQFRPAVEESPRIAEDARLQTLFGHVRLAHRTSVGLGGSYLESGSEASSRSGRGPRNARPRWLMRSFCSSVSGAIVSSQPSGTKIGS